MEIDVRLLAPIATVCGIAVSVLLWNLNQRAKHLTLRSLTNETLINVKGQARHRLSVTFDELPVDNINVVVLKLINSGGLAITASDFQAPLTVRMNSDAQLLAFDVIDSDPVDLCDRFNADGSRELLRKATEHVLTFQPVLLNPNDSITVQLLVQNYHGIAHIGSHIQGIKRVETRQRASTLPSFLTQVGAFTMVAAVFLTKPESILTLNLERLMPFILLFLLGYLFLWSGLFLPRRRKASAD